MRVRAFTLLEVMVVAAVAGILSAAAAFALSDRIDQARAEDEGHMVAGAVRTLRSQALRQGQAAAISTDATGRRLQMGVVDKTDGCARFLGDPTTALRTYDFELKSTVARLTDDTGTIRGACFSSLSFIPLDTAGNGPVPLTVSVIRDDDVGGVEVPRETVVVGQAGTISSTDDERFREGVAATNLRVAANVDLAAQQAVIPPDPTAPLGPPPGPPPPPVPPTPPPTAPPATLPPPTSPPPTSPPPAAPPAAPPPATPPPATPPPASPPPAGGGGGGGGGGGSRDTSTSMAMN